MFISKEECKKSGGKFRPRKGYYGDCHFSFHDYELHEEADECGVSLMTENDWSVGIRGVNVSPCFRSVKALNKWFRKHEKEFQEIIEIDNDKLYWKRMEAMASKR